jgi:hypothetical protein
MTRNVFIVSGDQRAAARIRTDAFSRHDSRTETQRKSRSALTEGDDGGDGDDDDLTTVVVVVCIKIESEQYERSDPPREGRNPDEPHGGGVGY